MDQAKRIHQIEQDNGRTDTADSARRLYFMKHENNKLQNRHLRMLVSEMTGVLYFIFMGLQRIPRSF